MGQTENAIRYEIALPETNGVDQDGEFCEVVIDDERRRIRFHDYHEIYSVPGLYEQLFYELLACDSPRIVRDLLEEELEAHGDDPQQLSALDVGAGNGMMGEQLTELGAHTVVGVDIIEEAAEAAERDRPDVYDDYHVLDLTDPPEEGRAALREYGFNCLSSVAALGFGDIPPEAFTGACEFVDRDGWIAFCIKEDFVTPDRDESGFSRLIRESLEDGTLESCREHTYRHRLSSSGEPLNYVAIVARKRGELRV